MSSRCEPGPERLKQINPELSSAPLERTVWRTGTNKVPKACQAVEGHSHRPKGDPGGSDGKESACETEDLASIPESGRSPEEGHGTPLQCSCWRIPWTEEPGGPQGRKELNMTEQVTLSKG